jgi:hypothetical protein
MHVGKEGLSKGEIYLNLFEVNGLGGFRTSLRNFSDFPLPRIGFSTFSEANLLGNCCNLRIY